MIQAIVPVCILAAFEIFFIFGFQQFDFDVSRCGVFYIYFVWDSPSFFVMGMYVCVPIWGKFGFFYKFFFRPIFPFLLGF